MSRADDMKAQYEAELELVELEDESIKLKADPGDGRSCAR